MDRKAIIESEQKVDQNRNVLDTQDLETITGLAVDKVFALHLDGGDGIRSGRKSAKRSEKTSVHLYTRPLVSQYSFLGNRWIYINGDIEF